MADLYDLVCTVWNVLYDGDVLSEGQPEPSGEVYFADGQLVVSLSPDKALRGVGNIEGMIPCVDLDDWLEKSNPTVWMLPAEDLRPAKEDINISNLAASSALAKRHGLASGVRGQCLEIRNGKFVVDFDDAFEPIECRPSEVSSL